MKNTRKFKRVKKTKFSKKNRKGGTDFFPKGYNPIKGIGNTLKLRSKGSTNNPVIGQHVGLTGQQMNQIIQPLQDVENKMTFIMNNISDLKLKCLSECIKNASNIDNETASQIKAMTQQKDIYEWGNMCSTSLNTTQCKELMKNIKDMELYINYIKKLSEMSTMYESKLVEIKKNIDMSSMDINENF